MRLRKLSVFLSALVLSVALLAQSVIATEPGLVTPEQGRAMVQEKEGLVILDVRNRNEYVVDHYAGSLNIPVNELEARIAEVPADKPVVVHCFKGIRAKRAYEILKEKRPDIKELYYIGGGEILFR